MVDGKIVRIEDADMSQASGFVESDNIMMADRAGGTGVYWAFNELSDEDGGDNRGNDHGNDRGNDHGDDEGDDEGEKDEKMTNVTLVTNMMK